MLKYPVCMSSECQQFLSWIDIPKYKCLIIWTRENCWFWWWKTATSDLSMKNCEMRKLTTATHHSIVSFECECWSVLCFPIPQLECFITWCREDQCGWPWKATTSNLETVSVISQIIRTALVCSLSVLMHIPVWDSHTFSSSDTDTMNNPLGEKQHPHTCVHKNK